MGELETHEAIRRLIASYAQLLDSRRLEERGELFTPDATFEVRGRTLRGRALVMAGEPLPEGVAPSPAY
jgi:3-phenylpropionate/cinnamic acid dioxygenase small subunit